MIDWLIDWLICPHSRRIPAKSPRDFRHPRSRTTIQTFTPSPCVVSAVHASSAAQIEIWENRKLIGALTRTLVLKYADHSYHPCPVPLRWSLCKDGWTDRCRPMNHELSFYVDTIGATPRIRVKDAYARRRCDFNYFDDLFYNYANK